MTHIYDNWKKYTKRQEAFREQRHLRVFNLWHVSLTFWQGQKRYYYSIQCCLVEKCDIHLSLLILIHIFPVISYSKNVYFHLEAPGSAIQLIVINTTICGYRFNFLHSALVSALTFPCLCWTHSGHLYVQVHSLAEFFFNHNLILMF